MNTKRFFMMFIAVFSILTFAPVGNCQKSLVGVWESPDTTKGGLGAIYEFREDGGLMVGMGALVDSKFDPNDPNLQQLMMQPDDKKPAGDDRPQKIMDGPAGSPSYVGVWKFRHYTGGFAFMRITEDGRTMLRVPFPLPWGKYQIKGKKLRLIQKECPPVDVTYKVTDKTLELSQPGKKKIRLVRVQPAWYHALTESEAEAARIRLQEQFKEGDQRNLNGQMEEDKNYKSLEQYPEELREPPQIEDYAPGIID